MWLSIATQATVFVSQAHHSCPAQSAGQNCSIGEYRDYLGYKRECGGEEPSEQQRL